VGLDDLSRSPLAFSVASPQQFTESAERELREQQQSRDNDVYSIDNEL